MYNSHTISSAARNLLLSLFVKVLAAVDGRKPNVGQMHARTLELLKQAHRGGTLAETVRQLVIYAGLENFLPESYARFQRLVVEGLTFMLAALPLERLAQKVVDQLRLPQSASPGQRACVLIKDMPTLQKLGQIICRNRGLEPDFRSALIDLEDNIRTVSYDELKPLLEGEIKAISPDYRVEPEERILAEASVCAVIPATVRRQEDGAVRSAVLKVLKPAVKQYIHEELAIWDRLVLYLDQQRDLWGLEDFNFTGTLKEVRRLLEKEVDLDSEQHNLDVVQTYFASDDRVTVPQKLDVSTSVMTAMTRLEGTKITDVAHLTKRQRRLLAASLVKTCILRPIQDPCDETVFHGDPHAGNLAYRFDGDRPRIIFYDWGMLGRLTRLERFGLTLLGLGIMAGHRKVVFLAADLIANGQASSSAEMRLKIEAAIESVLENREGRVRGILTTIEALFERLTYLGVVFSANLSMYEKAMVTLKGVLSEIDPGFDRDDYLIWETMVTFLSDLFRLKLHKLVLDEIWAVYRYSLAKFLEVQKVLVRFAWDMGCSWVRLPAPAYN